MRNKKFKEKKNFLNTSFRLNVKLEQKKNSRAFFNWF